MINKDKICFIKDRRDFFYSEIKRQGYKVYSPYIDKTIIGRVIREIWFRIKLPEYIWYNKELLKNKVEFFFVSDTLITKKYLEWLQVSFPKAKIIFQYNNLIGKARHIKPNDVPDCIYVETYDEADSKKYGLHLRKNGLYVYRPIDKKKDIKYDVIYVGRDKGRAEYLLRLQNQMHNMGLKTKFIVTPNGRFYIPKKHYSKPIPYENIVDLLTESRAVLNIALPGQKGATIRDYESIFHKVKLITNNENIKNYEFYIPENVFILGERDLSELPKFLETPFVSVPQYILNKYTLDNYIEGTLRNLRE